MSVSVAWKTTEWARAIAEVPRESVQDVAKHLGVAKDSVYRWIAQKGRPAHRVGWLRPFKLSEIDEWVQAGGAGQDEPDEGKEDR